MRVLHVIDSGGLYGAEKMLLSLAGEQQRLGLAPALASIGRPGEGAKAVEREAAVRGLAVEPFRMRSGPNFPGALDIARFARAGGAELIHTHGYKADILFGFLPRMLRRLPVVATVHGWTERQGLNRMRFYAALHGLSLRFVDRVVLVNGAMRSHPRLRGCRQERLAVVANGLSLTDEGEGRSQPADPAVLQFCSGGYTLGAIGRLSIEKGFTILLDAFASLAAQDPRLRLLILGEGPQRPVLEAKISQLGLEQRVLLPGYREGAARYLPSLGAFVLPSLSEGLPMVLLEALHAGVPVVATRVGGVPEVLEGEAAGILVCPGDAGALSRGIGRLLADPAAAAERVSYGRRLLESRYTARAMAQKYLEIYQGVAMPGGICAPSRPENH